jgi:hypothetical protein
MIKVATESRIEASKLATLYVKTWENALSYRISCQKSLDIVSKLPVRNLPYSEDLISNSVYQEILKNLYDILNKLIQGNDNVETSSLAVISWEDISTQHDIMKKNWKEVINKWYSRLQFGSKDAISKMKTFKQSFWEQV